VFMFMAMRMDADNRLIVSQWAIAEMLGYSLRSVSRATTYLKDNNHLNISKIGTSSVYHINAQIINKRNQ